MNFEQHLLKFVYLLSSLIGISLIYYASVLSEPKEVSISDVNAEMIGSSIKIKGEITKVRLHQDGHIFITITDGSSKINIPLFASFLSSSELNINKLNVGTKIAVTGTIDIYNNQLQIIPKKSGDLKILGG